jgi:hypothetical protein
MGIGSAEDLQANIVETVQAEIESFSAAYLEANSDEAEGPSNNN